MNYGEELAYWYLRLNGFFPISNFVVHRSSSVEHTSDVDVLAVRLPFVYEEVGGQEDDWDVYLTQELKFHRQIGIVCEVKTGAFEEARLFRSGQIQYTLPRLGMIPLNKIAEVVDQLAKSPAVEIDDGSLVAKLFISPDPHHAGPYLNRSMAQIEDFISERVRRYSVRKFADRMFVPSTVLQMLIAQVAKQIERRGKI